MSLIDVHAHFLPDHYRDALAAAGIDQPDGFPRVPTWSAEEHLAVMDRLGIDAAVLSVSSPGVRFGTGESASNAVALARHVNDVAAATVAEHPGRFGAFASLPMPRSRRVVVGDRAIARRATARRREPADERRWRVSR